MILSEHSHQLNSGLDHRVSHKDVSGGIVREAGRVKRRDMVLVVYDLKDYA